ncbi:MAG: KH domain-containing protein [Solobacterium sp.]|nr:KH domain-containing protein [Solobacterium sp.]
MAELDKVLYDLVSPMVDDKNSLEVKELPSGNSREVILSVTAKDDDIARLIGRRGSMASALRQVMSVASHADDRKVTIKFNENGDEDETGLEPEAE